MRRPSAQAVAVLCLLALGPLAGCGAGDGDGSGVLPSVTASLSPTRTLPSLTRPPAAPTASESPAPPTRTRTPLPDPTRTAPTAPSERPSATEPAPAATSSVPSPEESPAAEDQAATAADEEEAISPIAWVALALLALAAVLGTWLFVRARRRRDWRERLESAADEVSWFARELVPQLRVSRSVDQVVGGWHVVVPRVAAAEDQLTVLSSSAPSPDDAARALQLRDAVRAARDTLEGLSGPESHDAWALDLDEVEALLVAALGPEPATSR